MRLICVIILVFITGIIVGSYIGAKNNEVVTYNFDVIGEDLILRNFTLVTFENKYYITSDTRIEKRSASKSEINNCILEISRDAEVLMSSGFSFQKESVVMSGDDYYELFSDKLSSTKEKITKAKEIQVKFNYTIDGVEKEDIQTVELDKHIDKKL
ncbi:hypothetical protein D3C81_551310 [compost metagenome]